MCRAAGKTGLIALVESDHTLGLDRHIGFMTTYWTDRFGTEAEVA